MAARPGRNAGAKPSIESFRLADVRTLLASIRVGSVNGAARATGVTPSQVSKAVARLERQLGVQLVFRSPRGIALTEDGKRAVPEMARLLEVFDEIGRPYEPSDLTIVGTSFLNEYFLPSVVAALPELRFRCLQAAPSIPTAFAGHATFDVALTVERNRWPSPFVALEIGKVRRALFASPAVATRLDKRTTVDTLAGEEFIGAIYSDGAQAHTGDDRCPLPAHARHIRHRTETAGLALSIAAATSQLVFAPTLAARPFVERRQLVEIPVRGWKVHDPLYLVCHQERVHARVQRTIATAMKKVLSAERTADA